MINNPPVKWSRKRFRVCRTDKTSSFFPSAYRIQGFESIKAVRLMREA